MSTDEVKIIGIDTTSKCNPIVTLSHKEACPVFSATGWLDWLATKPYISTPLLIILGVIVTLIGRKFFPWTIFFVGAGIGFGSTMVLF